MSQASSEQRRHLRFPPEEWEIALIQCSDAPLGEDDFRPEIASLVMEESRAGCGLVTLRRQLADRLKVGDRCQVKVASLGIVLAEVKWIREADDDAVARLGLEYVEY
ncbi:hypothetical protein [Wenzhouxiangella marina]|uniref:Uncharacterized protein n=1 Tax=Wenzhouxiangella marina TaxID=1579979 RepID=A0A0K0XXK6_9GAMM|nr:hypothetical protein [Wenzhouxiangella marina]AKS42367.1 hypothetical protein WM2015_2001 [Wenzhouxiangella marina]MBB6085860.1 hypothetical protein [Wenzhouxiangella marina]